eukprot:scaffold71_cov247-Pinguiococcus_pyrenoidosus.AAC.29
MASGDIESRKTQATSQCTHWCVEAPEGQSTRAPKALLSVDSVSGVSFAANLRLSTFFSSFGSSAHPLIPLIRGSEVSLWYSLVLLVAYSRYEVCILEYVVLGVGCVGRTSASISRQKAVGKSAIKGAGGSPNASSLFLPLPLLMEAASGGADAVEGAHVCQALGALPRDAVRLYATSARRRARGGFCERHLWRRRRAEVRAQDPPERQLHPGGHGPFPRRGPTRHGAGVQPQPADHPLRRGAGGALSAGNGRGGAAVWPGEKPVRAAGAGRHARVPDGGVRAALGAVSAGRQWSAGSAAQSHRRFAGVALAGAAAQRAGELPPEGGRHAQHAGAADGQRRGHAAPEPHRACEGGPPRRAGQGSARPRGAHAGALPSRADGQQAADRADDQSRAHHAAARGPVAGRLPQPDAAPRHLDQHGRSRRGVRSLRRRLHGDELRSAVPGLGVHALLLEHRWRRKPWWPQPVVGAVHADEEISNGRLRFEVWRKQFCGHRELVRCTRLTLRTGLLLPGRIRKRWHEAQRTLNAEQNGEHVDLQRFQKFLSSVRQNGRRPLSDKEIKIFFKLLDQSDDGILQPQEVRGDLRNVSLSDYPGTPVAAFPSPAKS